MSSESVFLTDEEASALQEAVGRIVATGLQMPHSEIPLPVAGGNDSPVDLPPGAVGSDGLSGDACLDAGQGLRGSPEQA